MIKQLTIKNFQSHRNTILDFHSGVNVIIGLSQSGKTAILRALNWVINNRPSGFRFHSNFVDEKNTSVSLQFDFCKIKLIKSERSAKYLFEKNGKKEEFEGFGQHVPDKISSVLNISELNIQSQLDNPFLITSSSGEIARTINKITRLEKIDEWQSKLTSEINNTKRKIEERKEEVKTIKAELNKYEGIDKVEELVNYAEGIARKNHKVVEDLEDLVFKVNRICDLEREIDKQKDILSLEKKLEFAEDLSFRVKNDKILCKEITETINIIKKKKEEIKNLKDYIQNKISEQVDLLKKLGKCPLCLSEINEKQMSKIIKELD